MPGPTLSQVHVDAALTNLSVAYVQNQNNFVADKLFPIVPTDKQSDVYFKFDMGDFNRDEAKDRAPGTESAGGDYDLTTESFSCKVKAFHKDIPDQIRANADIAADQDRAATEFVTQKMLIAKEVQFASSFMATGLWGYERAGDASGSVGTGEVVYWDDYTNSDPIQDITDAADGVHLASGFRPNKLVLGQTVYSTLKNHPDFVDRIKGGATPSEAAIVARRTMAELFEVDEVLVMGAVKNTAKKGQTASNAFIGGNHALLAYAAPTPSVLAASAGYTFSWNGYTGSSDGITIAKFRRANEFKADRVEGEVAFDQKLVAADLGAFFKDIVQ